MFGQRRMKSSLKDFDQSLQRDSLNSESYQARARCKELLGDSLGALEDSNAAKQISFDRRTTQIRQTLQPALTEVSSLWGAVGRIEQTLLEVHQMLEEKPEPEILADASIHSTLRQMHEQLAKLDTALREFRLSKLQEQIASLRANIARITG